MQCLELRHITKTLSLIVEVPCSRKELKPTRSKRAQLNLGDIQFHQHFHYAYELGAHQSGVHRNADAIEGKLGVAEHRRELGSNGVEISVLQFANLGHNEATLVVGT